ncbi:MAG: hypothetical protein ABIJ27_05700, partial [Candidatus Omnitrophota bacterium]
MNSRDELGMAGPVQQAASTLPAEAFGKFPETEAAEVHLATEFQNMVYESRLFPRDLKEKMYAWLRENRAEERKPDETEEQFIYKTRKKALGPFKKEIMGLPRDVRDGIAKEIEQKFEFLFEKLNMANTKEFALKYVPLKRVISRKRKAVAAGAIEIDHEAAD